MAQDYCVARLPQIGETQPPVLAWSDHRGGCRGSTGTFPVPARADLRFGNMSYGIAQNDIDAMWVPPNVEVYLNGDDELYHQRANIYVDGSHTAGSGINYPGLYQFDQNVQDIKPTGRFMEANDIDILTTATTKTWEEHLYGCCSNPNADVRTCGVYKPGAAVCKSRLAKCTGSKLKDDEGCQTMCRADPVACDKVKRQFCDANPSDRWCSCMNVESNPEFIALQNRIIQKTGQSPRLACSPFGRCMTGTDLTDIYLPKNIIDDRGNTCPSYTSYLDQSINTSGQGNIVTGTQSANQGGAAGTNTSGGSAPGIAIQEQGTGGSNNIVNFDQSLNASPPIIQGVSNQTLLIIVGFVLLVVAAAWFGMSDTDNSSQLQMMQLQMQMAQQMQPMPQPMPPPMMYAQPQMQQPMYYQ